MVAKPRAPVDSSTRWRRRQAAENTRIDCWTGGSPIRRPTLGRDAGAAALADKKACRCRGDQVDDVVAMVDALKKSCYPDG